MLFQCDECKIIFVITNKERLKLISNGIEPAACPICEASWCVEVSDTEDYTYYQKETLEPMDSEEIARIEKAITSRQAEKDFKDEYGD